MLIHDYVKGAGDAVYAVFRVIVGFLFAMHGAQKFGIWGDFSVPAFAGVFGLPLWLAYAVALVELIGGIAILLGVLTRLSAILAGIVMVGALVMVHFPKGWNPLVSGGELPLLFLVSFLVLLIWGAGKWSLEYAMTKKEVF